MVRRLAAVAVTMAVVVALGSCGDDGGDDEGPGTTETSAPTNGY
jgi:hypothetical protein